MKVLLVPVTEGMKEEAIIGRLQAGWVLIGRQSVDLRTSVIDPTKPMAPSGVIDVDVWALPEPTMPLPMVTNAIFEARQAEKPLEAVVRKLFGVDLETFMAQIEADRNRERLQ
jgi:hypothetical protein